MSVDKLSVLKITMAKSPSTEVHLYAMIVFQFFSGSKDETDVSKLFTLESLYSCPKQDTPDTLRGISSRS